MTPFRLLILTIGLFATGFARGEGAWVKSEPATFPFVIVKAGKFGRHGTFTPLAVECREGKRWAWISHLLAPGEKMDEKAGDRLGQTLAPFLKKNCFEGVELDIEPLSTTAEWLAPFLRHVKKGLGGDAKLSVAVYPSFEWDRIIMEVDRIDLMLYDTGAKDEAAYRKQLVDVAANIQKQRARFLVGLPAYPDRTKRHRPAAENLAVAEKVPDLYCGGEWAIYAGWTATDSELAVAKRMATTCPPRAQ